LFMKIPLLILSYHVNNGLAYVDAATHFVR